MNETPSVSAVPSDDRTMAMLSHLLGIITGFIGALVIWLINKDKPEKAFVIDQSKEALNFQITVLIAVIVSMILMTVTLGLLFFLPMAVGIANLVLCIIAGLKANEGVAYRYPFALRLIK
ncbi:MAG: DUF4870 domain-containing protein [Pseudomonadota bacterium]|nr:DUF4870 domain-containing protein [Pseudomonadota bacterium]